MNRENIMSGELRTHISETCGNEFWESVTTRLFPTNSSPFQIYSFEHDIEHDGETWRCVILTKTVYDPDRPDEVDYAEDILAHAWKI